MKKNKNLNKIEKYDSLIIRNINRKLLENNINVYFLVDNNIKNKNEINKVLKYYFKLITQDTKLKPIIKKKNKKPPLYKYERNILPKLINKKTVKDNVEKINNKYLDFKLEDIMSDDSTIDDDELNKNITPVLIFEKYLYKDCNRPFLKNNKIDRFKYINTKIDYISNIINNKNKDNFNIINQLIYKRTILNKLTLENKTSQKDFLDIVKKTRDELKTYIKSLNSILV